MTKEEIEEGNKLIAEFMGWKYIAADETKHFKYDYYIQPDRNHFDAWRLEYHSSWDWLMPVYKKIKDMPCIKMPMNGIADSVMPHINQMGLMKNGAIQCDLEKCWIGIVQFIKWHNTHTQTTHK